MDEISIAYISMLTESPVIDSTITPASMSAGATSYRDFIANNHSNATDLGNSYFRLDHPNGGQLNYRYENGKQHELSFIHKNTQTGVEKGTDGNVDHIHNLMKQHIEDYGTLMTDSSNTNGSKNMWVNFIKKNPNLKYHIDNRNTKKKIPVNASNIESKASHIWGTTEFHKNIRLVATK